MTKRTAKFGPASFHQDSADLLDALGKPKKADKAAERAEHQYPEGGGLDPTMLADLSRTANAARDAILRTTSGKKALELTQKHLGRKKSTE